MIQLNFRDNLAAQDMIKIIMCDKNLSIHEAIEFAINREIYKTIITKRYADIAFSLWGHDDPDREWDTLEKPIIDIEFDKLRQRLIEDIAERYNIDIETSVCYFLIFTMDFSGYHI